jgi:hypothetical protein
LLDPTIKNGRLFLWLRVGTYRREETKASLKMIFDIPTTKVILIWSVIMALKNAVIQQRRANGVRQVTSPSLQQATKF